MTPSPTATGGSLDVLPHPTGRYAVGRVAMEFLDRSRRDIYAAEPDTCRELVLWTWYPAAQQPAGELAEHLPEAWAPVAHQLGIAASGVHTHAFTDAPIAEDQANFPVLVLSPSGFSPLLVSAIAEQLASIGYVVVGVNHTYETAVTAFADGRVVPMNTAALGGALGPQSGSHIEAFRLRAGVCAYKAADLRSVADHLERLEPNPAGLTSDRLDLTRLGAFGHSFGGNAAVEWCRSDRRCRAAANMDGAIWTEVGALGLRRPALQILADHPEFELAGSDAVDMGLTQDAGWHDAERALTCDGWRTVHRLASPGYTARVSGSRHMSFMDIPFLPLYAHSPVSAMLGDTTIEGERMWRITTDLLLAFFSRHVGGPDARPIESLGGLYPEITSGSP